MSDFYLTDCMIVAREHDCATTELLDSCQTLPTWSEYN